MKKPMPRWLLITLIALAVAVIVTGLVVLTIHNHTVGWTVSGVLIALLAALAAIMGPQLYKLYKFQKYFKAHEGELKMLPTLMQTGRTQEALARFDGVMKHAPDSAYMLYMKAYFLQAAGKLPEALNSANKALSLAPKDPFLLPMLQQAGGMMGQPKTVDEFKTQVSDLVDSLEPRVNQMRQRREKAAEKRKKKSR